jgi:teichuronic acid biosynthesis glycosyltransferase TuaC
VRALVISDMKPDAASPERGRFVRDQVAALRTLDGVEVELVEFAPGPRALAGAAAALARRFGFGRGDRERPDVVHAHFGLTAWPALTVPAGLRALTVHGTDVRHPRTRVATAAVLPLMDLVAAASEELAHALPLRSARERARVLPCGVDMERFRPIPRAQARRELGLEAGGRYLLFGADPARSEKRHDRAAAVAEATGARLLALGGVAPDRVPLWVNAANAVLVPSEREGFGLAVLEALACDVPVLATPVGVHPQALAGVAGTLCAPYDLAVWRAAAEAAVQADDPRVDGRAAAEPFSAVRMAERVLAAWREGPVRSRHRAG